MDETVIFVADEGPPAAASAACGVWLAHCIGVPPRICLSVTPEGIVAYTNKHGAGLIVVPALDDGNERLLGLMRLHQGSLVVLPPLAVDLWLDPVEARRRAAEVIVVGADGSPGARDAAWDAGRIAAGFDGEVLVTHIQSHSARGLPAKASPTVADPIAWLEHDYVQELLTPTVRAAAAHGAGTDVTVVAGAVEEELNEVCATQRSPLLAIGSSSLSDDSAPAESVAMNLLEAARQPVLVATGGGLRAPSTTRWISTTASRSSRPVRSEKPARRTPIPV